MLNINRYAYINRAKINKLKKLKKLNISKEEIAKYDEPQRMYIYCYFGYFKELCESIKYFKSFNSFISELSLIAAYTGNTKILKYLIKNNYLDMNITDISYNSNCFLIATRKGHIKFLKILFKHVNNNELLFKLCSDCCDPNCNAFTIALYWQHIKILDLFSKTCFKMYYFRGIDYYFNYTELVDSEKFKSLKYLDKIKHFITNEQILDIIKYNTNNKTLKYFYGKGRRLYGIKKYKHIMFIDSCPERKFYLNYICINQLLFI